MLCIKFHVTFVHTVCMYVCKILISTYSICTYVAETNIPLFVLKS